MREFLRNQRKTGQKRGKNTSTYLEKYHFRSLDIKSRGFHFFFKIEPIEEFPLKGGKITSFYPKSTELSSFMMSTEKSLCS
jgi:hypothetical protein